MPELRWEPSDFLACLEAEPTIDEDETGYHYSVARDGLRLDLSVFPYASDVCISVYRENVERPVFTFTITACSGTRFVNDGRGEFLQFVPSQVFGDRFHSDFVIPIGVRVSVKPSISIEMFHEPT